MTYIEANKLLADTTCKPINRNTRLIRLQPDGEIFRIGLQLHNTVVIVFNSDETQTLNTGRKHTRLTKDRINEYCFPGFRVFVRNKQMRLETTSREGNKFNFRFVDKMTINPDWFCLFPDGTYDIDENDPNI